MPTLSSLNDQGKMRLFQITALPITNSLCNYLYICETFVLNISSHLFFPAALQYSSSWCITKYYELYIAFGIWFWGRKDDFGGIIERKIGPKLAAH